MISVKEFNSTVVQDQSQVQAQAIEIKPRRVDLVECLDSGQRYLRAYQGGHFYWQPVSGSAEAIVDSGAWRTGSEYHQRYWLNLGPWRRRGGRYYEIGEQGQGTRAA